MEYPFKDLLPLDEVLAREGYYKDWTHLDPEVFYSLTQISEYIKTKGYGVDVRLLIAQLAEHFGLKTTQVVDLGNLIQAEHATLKQQVQQAVAQVNADRNALETQFNQSVAQMEADKDAVIANATVDSEVILARGGKPTLGARLDETTAQLAQKANEYEVRLKSVGININDLDEPTRQTFLEAQGIDVNYVLGLRNVKAENTDFIEGKDTFGSGGVIPFVERLWYQPETLKLIVINNTRVAIKEIRHGETYRIKLSGEANRFRVFLTDSLEIGSSVDLLLSGDNITPKTFTFTNKQNRKYLLVGVSDLAQNPTVEVESQNLFIQNKTIIDHIPAGAITFDKIDFIDFGHTSYGLNREATLTSNLWYEPTSLIFITINDTKSAVKEIRPHETYTITIDGESDRFRVLLANSLEIGSPVSVINSNDKLNPKTFTFTNDDGFKYLFVGVSSTNQTPDVFIQGENVYIADTKITNTEKNTTADPWTDNRFVLPDNLYLVPDIDYAISAQNFNRNAIFEKDIENIGYELALPNKVIQFNRSADIRLPYEMAFDTKIVGKSKEFSEVLNKDIKVHVKAPQSVVSKTPDVLMIGDSTTHSNLPALLKFWLSKWDITPNMIGTVFNDNPQHGYEIADIGGEYGEGKRGWRLADMSGDAKLVDGSSYIDPRNPFINNGVWDFENYMSVNGFTNVDIVVIQLGTNDIISYSDSKVSYGVDIDFGTKTTRLTNMPNWIQKMVNSIKDYNPNVKIAINPPQPAGTSKVFNLEALEWAETQQKTFQNQENVYCLPNYIGYGNMSTASYDGKTKTPISQNNNSYFTPLSTNVHPDGMGQAVNALWTASWLIHML